MIGGNKVQPRTSIVFFFFRGYGFVLYCVVCSGLIVLFCWLHWYESSTILKIQPRELREKNCRLTSPPPPPKKQNKKNPFFMLHQHLHLHSIKRNIPAGFRFLSPQLSNSLKLAKDNITQKADLTLLPFEKKKTTRNKSLKFPEWKYFTRSAAQTAVQYFGHKNIFLTIARKYFNDCYYCLPMPNVTLTITFVKMTNKMST